MLPLVHGVNSIYTLYQHCHALLLQLMSNTKLQYTCHQRKLPLKLLIRKWQEI